MRVLNKYHFYLALACFLFFFFPEEASNQHQQLFETDDEDAGSDENDDKGQSSSSSADDESQTLAKSAIKVHKHDGNALKGDSSSDHSTCEVEFYLRRRPYADTWAHCLCHDFDGHFDDERTQTVYFNVKLVYNDNLSQRDLPDASRFHREVLSMPSKCSTCKNEPMHKLTTVCLLQRSYPWLVSAVHAKTSQCTNSLLYACYS